MKLLLPALLAVAGSALAADGGATIRPGDSAFGEIAPGETDRIAFDGVAGQRISASVAADFEPELRLFGPGPVELDVSGREREGKRSVRLRSVVLPATGRYVLSVEVHGNDGGGRYALRTRSAPPRGLGAAASGAPGGTVALPLGDLPGGGILRLRAARGALSSLQGPGGPVPLGGGRSAVVVLPATGAWAVEVAADARGAARVSASLRIPRGVRAEREVLDIWMPPPVAADVVGRVVLVRFRDGADDAAFDDRHGCDTGEGIAGTGFTRVAVPDGVGVDEFLDELGLDADVVEREAVFVSESPEGEQSAVPFTASDATKNTVAQQDAFALTGVLDAQALAGGAGVVVAIVDTGLLAGHPDLAGRTLPGYDFVDGDADPADGPNGLDDDGDMAFDEGVGHGTLVAGLVASMAPGASILPVRVLDSDARGTSENVARGIVWAVDAGAKVVNLSLGIRQASAVIQDAVNYAKGRDVLVVAAAGNANLVDAVAFPASLSDVLTVAAVDNGGVRAPFSNVAGRVDLVAPGVGLTAPWQAGGYGTASGTSFATPFAAAGAALVLSRNPGMKPRDAGRRLADTAVPVDALNPAYAGRLGRGRIDLLRAVKPK